MKISFFQIFLNFYILLWSSQGQGHSVKLGTYTSSSITQTLLDGTVSLPKKPDPKDFIYDIDIGVSQAKSKNTNSTTSDSLFGLGLLTPQDWSIRTAISFSRNLSENLYTVEPFLSVSKKIFYNSNQEKKSSNRQSQDENKNTFEPYFIVGANGARSFMTQTSTTSRSIVIFGLQQTAGGLNISWQPLENWSFGLSATRYSYDHDIRDLYTRLGNYPYLMELNSHWLAINDAVSTLPESSSTLSIGYILNDDWNFALDTQRVRDFVSEQYGTTNTISLNYYFLNSWVFHFGTGNSIRSDDNDKSAFSEISISYAF